LHRSGLGGIDRTLGAGFGLLRGVFLIALVMLIIKMTSLPYQEYRNQSRLYSVFDPAVSLLYEYTPEIIKQMKVFDKDSQHS
jgi:membrane protein required for colicin V production